jgi:hypothetical protein
MRFLAFIGGAVTMGSLVLAPAMVLWYITGQTWGLRAAVVLGVLWGVKESLQNEVF